MAANNGVMEPFNPKNMKWDTYVERLHFYFEANSIESENQKRAILLTVCGVPTFEVIKSIVTPLELSKVSYREIINKSRAHFSP